MSVGKDETPDSMAEAEARLARTRARLSDKVGRLRAEAARLRDTSQPAVTIRSATGTPDVVDLAAVALRAVGKLREWLQAAVHRPGPPLTVTGLLLVLLRTRHARKRRRLLERKGQRR